MVDEGRNPLEFDAVVRRFAESVEALANVREQLRVLTELRRLRKGQMRASKKPQDRSHASPTRQQAFSKGWKTHSQRSQRCLKGEPTCSTASN